MGEPNSLKECIRKRAGITLLEVIVVLAILMIVGAISYPLFANAKRNAAQSSCSQRLRQIYLAVELYGADYPGYRPYHRNIDIPASALSKPSALAPYLRSDEMVHCPIAPPCAKERLASTYTWTPAPTPGLPGFESYQVQFDEWFSDLTKGYPIIHCLVHDELHYFPNEGEFAEEVNPPFVIRLLPNGAVKQGRYQIHRGHDIARSCEQSR